MLKYLLPQKGTLQRLKSIFFSNWDKMNGFELSKLKCEKEYLLSSSSFKNRYKGHQQDNYFFYFGVNHKPPSLGRFCVEHFQTEKWISDRRERERLPGWSGEVLLQHSLLRPPHARDHHQKDPTLVNINIPALTQNCLSVSVSASAEQLRTTSSSHLTEMIVNIYVCNVKKTWRVL